MIRDGMVFGYLTVIVEADPIVEYQKNRRGEKRPINRSAWHCVCKCGKELVVKNSFLKSTSKCSDCRLIEMRAAAKKNLHNPDAYSKSRDSVKKVLPELTAFNHCWLNADRRGIDFDLSIDEFKELSVSNCHYCGQEPKHERRTKQGSFIYNGIDRVDSKFGYTKSNCVPCCKICNFMKKDFSVEEFLGAVSRIVDWQKKSA